MLGLDVGDARIGVALGDAQTRIASPYRTYERSHGKAEREILRLVETEAIDTLVIGLPLNERGERTAQCIKVESFCRRIARRCNVRLVFVDEHLTTAEAEQQLRDSGSRAKRRSIRQKGVLDAISASIILQSFFDGASN